MRHGRRLDFDGWRIVDDRRGREPARRERDNFRCDVHGVMLSGKAFQGQSWDGQRAGV
jgi:hypothetical protein